MKLILRCPECDNYYYTQINDVGIYNLTCKNNHQILYALTDEKYEILFESGVLAYVDGYYRESISSIAAAFERFIEFCIKLCLLNNDDNLKRINNTWNLIAKQSERQLGAFYVMYLNITKKEPPNLQKEMEFRNKIIHRGKIPNKKETIKYIECIYNHISEICKNLKAVIKQNTFDYMTIICASMTGIHLPKECKIIQYIHESTMLEDIFYDNPKAFSIKLEKIKKKVCKAQHLN